MIIPIIFSLTPAYDGLMYSWCFAKGIDFASMECTPVFAQQQYYLEWEKQKSLGISAGNAMLYGYELPVGKNQGKYLPVVFPESLIEEYISRFPSQTDAYIASLREPWPEMTAFVVGKIRELENETGKKAEAFLCIADTAFLRAAAKELGIECIHYEWSSFRPPYYRKAAMLDFTGSILDGELEQRYLEFKYSADVPVLTRREILALFLADDSLGIASEEDVLPEYEAGIALGYNIPHIMSSATAISAVELYAQAKKYYGQENCLVRYHPGDPVQLRLRDVKADEGSLIDFIRSCKRILCASSTIAFEAMLFCRPVYDLGKTEFAPFVNTSMLTRDDFIADEHFLSFYAFGYLVPFELLHNAEYLRWRLTRPSEEEIYRYHLDYYLNCYGLEEKVLQLDAPARFQAIMTQRGQLCADPAALDRAPLWLKDDYASRLAVSLQRKEHQLQAQEKRVQETLTAERLSWEQAFEQKNRELEQAFEQKNRELEERKEHQLQAQEKRVQETLTAEHLSREQTFEQRNRELEQAFEQKNRELEEKYHQQEVSALAAVQVLQSEKTTLDAEKLMLSLENKRLKQTIENGRVSRAGRLFHIFRRKPMEKPEP